MSTTAVKGVSAGDIRRMLELVAEVSQGSASVSERMGVVLHRLGEMTQADLAVVARVRREARKPLQFEALVEHSYPLTKMGEAGARPRAKKTPDGECITSIIPLKETGHYACLALHRCTPGAAGFTSRERSLADFVWQALGFLHDRPLHEQR